MAFLAASAEPEPELDAHLTDDELVDNLIQDLKPMEDEYDVDSRAGTAYFMKYYYKLIICDLLFLTDKADLGKDDETDPEGILDILNKELGPLMVGNRDSEERLLKEGLAGRGYYIIWYIY